MIDAIQHKVAATIVEILQHRALERPYDEAFHFIANAENAAVSLTYAHLDQAARSIGSTLRQRGAAGRPVLLLYPPGIAFITALFGCFYAGAIAVPLPVLAPQRAFERVPSIARDVVPVAGLTLAAFSTAVRHADASVRKVPWIATDQMTAGDGALVATDPDAIAMLQYSSGTTGAPRGVVLSHANLMHNCLAMARAVRPQPEDRAVSWLPMYHDMGLMGFVLFPVYAGFPCVLMSPMTFLKRPVRWLEAVSAWRATLSAAPCFAYDLCTHRTTPEQRDALDLSRWRIAVCGGEVVRPDVLERFAISFAAAGFNKRALAPAYGLAESTLLACSVGAGQGLDICAADAPALSGGQLVPPQSPARERRLAGCGSSWEGQQVAIVDPDRRVRLADGQVGEIWLRGGSIGLGYWQQPLATAETFQAVLADDGEPEPWLRTGDLGAISSCGLVVTGRRKDLIVVRGENHDPLDLEVTAAASHSLFIEGGGGAFSIDTIDGEAAVLLQEVRRSDVNGFNIEAAIAAVVSALARSFGLTLYDIAFLRPGTLPRTTSGKIQRHLCRQRYLSGELERLAEQPHPGLGRWRRPPPC